MRVLNPIKIVKEIKKKVRKIREEIEEPGIEINKKIREEIKELGIEK